QQRDTWKQFLKEKVFLAWPGKVATPELRRVSEFEKNGLQLVEYEFTSQEHVTLPVFVLQRPNAKKMVVRVLDQNDWDVFSKNLNSRNFENLNSDENASIAFVA